MPPLCSKCGQAKTQRPNGRWCCKPCENSYQRAHYAANQAEYRVRKADWMAKARRNPAKAPAIRASQRKAYHNGGADKQRERRAKIQQEQPFRARAYIARHWNPTLTESDLRDLWESQGGRCALTGRPLSIAEADLDHILPQARGGSHELSNLRWVWRPANAAKGDMTDAEFLALCRQVAEWIGRRIMAVAS